MDKQEQMDRLIPQIGYPECFKDALLRVGDRLKKAMKRDGMPYEMGCWDLGPLPKELSLPYLFFLFVARINEVIDNLNLVLSDLKVLSTRMYLFEGAPKKRLYLLVRIFFYEFYRIREIFNWFLKELQREGMIRKEEVRPIRAIFNKGFKETIKLRNLLVHSSVYWRGKDQMDLVAVGGAYELGFTLVHKETEEEMSLQEVMRKVCDNYLKVFVLDGKRMADILQNIVEKGANYSLKRNN